ncbi:MAG: OmpA family protein [Spirochaetaceae bacterium]|nr:OmpA family protein [Spirochaetaceae bacterium]
MKRFLVLGMIFAAITQMVFAQNAVTEDEFINILVKNGFYNDFVSLKEEVAELKTLVSDLRAEISGKQSELAYLKNAVNSKAQELDALSAQKLRLQKEIEEASYTLASLQKQKDELNKNHVFNASIVKTEVPQNEDVKEVAETNLLDTVYFAPDSVNLTEAAAPSLNDIGERLRNNPLLKITLRGYSAPAGTLSGQMWVSEMRAKTAASYLKKNFDIDEERINIQWVGAKETPINANSSKFTELRVVEVFAI